MTRPTRPTGSTVQRVAAGFGSGLCICAALPPWGWWPLALVGIAVWAVLNIRPRWQQRFWVGVTVGLGWFLPSSIWMWTFSPLGWPIGVALWFGLVAGVVSAICPPTRWSPAALAGALVLSEWLRWHAPFGGVPISMLAITQAQGPLLPLARAGGPLAISLAVALLGGAIGWTVDAVITHDTRRVAPVCLALGIVCVAVGTALVVPRSTDRREIEVAAVQGGGEQQTRSFATDYAQVVQKHLDASLRIRRPVDLVVWPENVVNVNRWEGSNEQLLIAAEARRLHATMVVGVVEDADALHFYNEAVAIDPDGRQVDRYDKVRRVPFGEYVPLRFLIEPLARDRFYIPPRDAVVGEGPPVLTTDLGRLGVAISWEVFFSRRIRDATQHGAEIILNPTNGSSYWLTQVQTQQIAMSRLRAVETDRWVVQAAPTGFSALIDPDGQLIARTAIGEQAVVQGKASLRTGRSWWTVAGDVPALVLAFALLGGAWISSRRRSTTGTISSDSDRGPRPIDPDGTTAE